MLVSPIYSYQSRFLVPDIVSHVLDIDDPIPETSGVQPEVIHDEEKIANIVDMGFTPAQARKALRLNVCLYIIILGSNFN